MINIDRLTSVSLLLEMYRILGFYNNITIPPKSFDSRNKDFPNMSSNSGLIKLLVMGLLDFGGVVGSICVGIGVPQMAVVILDSSEGVGLLYGMC